MKITVGKVVKNIPKQFVDGVFLISEEMFESPGKIRLTPFERFLFAEAAWRMSHFSTFDQQYLDGFIPTHAALQTNRSDKVRYVVFYYNDNKKLNAMAIVPKNLYNKCPIEKRVKTKTEW